MGQMREVDALSDAIISTEKEIAGGAWGNEETDAQDETGDRSLEQIGEGLEGQHDAEDEDESEDDASEEAEDEEESEGEDEGEDGEGSEEPQGKAAKKDGEGDKSDAGDQQQAQKPEGRVPSARLREANERARLAEEALTAAKAQLEEAKKAPVVDPKIAALEAQVALLLQGQNRQQAPGRTEEPAEPKFEADSLFENPKGFVDHITSIVQKAVAPLAQQQDMARFETSMAIAHATHKDAFEQAFESLKGLNPQNPDDRATVQRIRSSPNPGEELVKWHKRQRTLAEVGDDPAAFRARIAQETRDTLMKDPEFRKALIADMRGEAAAGGQNGAPRNETRLPKSLARSGGSNLGAERADPRASDDSEQSVADAAWRT